MCCGVGVVLLVLWCWRCGASVVVLRMCCVVVGLLVMLCWCYASVYAMRARWYMLCERDGNVLSVLFLCVCALVNQFFNL